MRYSVSIVSHNQINLCLKAIKTILQFIEDVEIILTVNVEESLDELNQKMYNLILIKNESPLGFGQNHNNAFMKSSGELFLIVNPDIEIVAWDNFDFNEKTLYSPIVLNIDGTEADNRRSFPTPINIFRRKILKKADLKLDWLAGMFLIVPKKLFKQLNGFDASFFMYLEDTDLSIRVKKIGGELEIIKPCVIIHDAQRKSGKNMIHLFYHISSLIRVYFKYPNLIFK